jgi:prevent-host-death family protein
MHYGEKMTELTISISELRNRFDEYMQRLKSGEVIVVTKYGKPIAQFTPAKLIQEKQKLLFAPKRRKKGSGN